MPILWSAKTIQRDASKLLDNFELLVQGNTVPVCYSSIWERSCISNSHNAPLVV